MSTVPERNPSPLTNASCRTAGQDRQTRVLRAGVRKTRPCVLVAGGVVALLILAFWRPLQRNCTAYFLLRADAPSEEVLSYLLDEIGDPGALLARLWHTQKIPHRQFVAARLSRMSGSEPGLLAQLEPLLLEAAVDPDVEVRQMAFATLERLKHPQLHRLALEQLSDADPAVRLIGLQGLRSIASSNDVPVAMRSLEDPEPRVVVAAALVLRQVTGQDFGIKSTDALPQFICVDTNPPPAPNLEAIQQGLRRGEEWWTAHHSEYEPSIVLPSLEGGGIFLPTPDFKLQDCGGKTLQLAHFLGKNVLLFFWSPGAPASLHDVSALNALHQRHSEHLTILGVGIPVRPGCCDEHEHGDMEGQGHAHQHHTETAAKPQDPQQFRLFAEQAAERLNVHFPMLVDPEGKIGARFRANDLPLYVLIDSQGKIRRRFMGFRSEQALAAIVEGAHGSLPNTKWHFPGEND